MRAVTVLTSAAVAVATMAIVVQGRPPAINERGLAGRESLLRDLRLRVRDVRQGPDGISPWRSTTRNRGFCASDRPASRC